MFVCYFISVYEIGEYCDNTKLVTIARFKKENIESIEFIFIHIFAKKKKINATTEM